MEEVKKKILTTEATIATAQNEGKDPSNMYLYLAELQKEKNFLLTAAAPGAAGGAGAVAKFLDNLSKTIYTNPNSSVIGKILKYNNYLEYGSFSPDNAATVYEEFKSLPATATQFALTHACKMKLNGPKYLDKPFILSGSEESGRLVVVKLLRPNNSTFAYSEKLQECAMEEEVARLVDSAAKDIALVRSEVLEFQVGQSSTKALKMPMYLSTVGESPQFYPSVISAQCQRLLDGIKWLHSQGWVHLDVKATNVFIDVEGSWFLGDFGSAKRIGDGITSTTTQFCPFAVKGQKAETRHDFFMLLVMLLIELMDNKHEYVKLLFDSSSQHCVSADKVRTQAQTRIKEFENSLPGLVALLRELATCAFAR